MTTYIPDINDQTNRLNALNVSIDKISDFVKGIFSFEF